MTNRLNTLIGVLIALLLTVEVVGRYYCLTTFPLFMTDPDFEYIAAPNQDLSIYRHRFMTNQFSQRTLPLIPSDTLVYLLLGDSAVYGGNQLDQDSLASARMGSRLSRQMGKRVRALNVAATTREPDNLAAYVRKYGLFGARKIILVVSSHHAYDNMTFEPVVGGTDHPDHNEPLDLIKLLQKVRNYLSGNLSHPWPVASKPIRRTFNTGLDSPRKLIIQNSIDLTLYHYLTTDEIITHRLSPGGREIRDYCQKYAISLLTTAETLAFYGDGIHFNEQGRKHLADVLYPVLLNR